MKNPIRYASILLALLVMSSPLWAETKSRQFNFTYEIKVKDLEGKKKLQVWIPVPQKGKYQKISNLKVEGISSENYRFTKGKKFGNKFLYCEVDLGKEKIKEQLIRLRFQVLRKEVKKLKGKKEKTGRKGMSQEALKKYLKADRKVPVGHKEIRERLKEARVSEYKTPLDKAQAVYNYLIDRMKYDKSGTGWGRGDALWACNSKRGNCTDFHSVFISMMRTLKIPARFEIGFPLPADKKKGTIGGYHCWGWFYVDSLGWVPVDISEADKHPELKEFFFGGIDANRVVFTQGRDLVLNPPASQKVKNFFVYPVVEVDGKGYQKFTRKFTFAEVGEKK